MAAEWEQAGVTGNSTGWRAGHKQDRERFWFSRINSTWQRWHLQSGSKHCTAAAMREDTKRRQAFPSDCVSLCISFTAPPITWKSLRYCPSMFWHYSVSSTSPSSLHFSLSSSTSLYIFFFLHLPLSRCQSLIHLHRVKGYRVHSSGTLMPVPLSQLHWHRLMFSFCCSGSSDAVAMFDPVELKLCYLMIQKHY